jgi:hypothetical protein
MDMLFVASTLWIFKSKGQIGNVVRALRQVRNGPKNSLTVNQAGGSCTSIKGRTTFDGG